MRRRIRGVMVPAMLGLGLPGRALVLWALALHSLPVVHLVTTRQAHNSMIAREMGSLNVSPGQRVDTAPHESAACAQYSSRRRASARSRTSPARTSTEGGASPVRYDAPDDRGGHSNGEKKLRFDDMADLAESRYIEQVVARSAQRMVQESRLPTPRRESPVWPSQSVGEESAAQRVLVSPPSPAAKSEKPPFTLIAPPAPISMGAEPRECRRPSTAEGDGRHQKRAGCSPRESVAGEGPAVEDVGRSSKQEAAYPLRSRAAQSPQVLTRQDGAAPAARKVEESRQPAAAEWLGGSRGAWRGGCSARAVGRQVADTAPWHVPAAGANTARSHSASTAAPANGEGGEGAGDRIKVCVRKRPLSEKEVTGSQADVIHVGRSAEELKVLEYKRRLDLTEYVEQHDFLFDAVLSDACSNADVYNRTTRGLVEYVCKDSGKATVFAYGQTGAGKTFTMMGAKGQPGLYMSAAQDIFRMREEGQHEGLSVCVSFFEIYGGKIFDLLNSRHACVKREDGRQNVLIRGLTEHEISSAEELMQAIGWGHEARSRASTDANIDSSRSHAILQVGLRKGGKDGKSCGKLSFIDLAGSERASDTGRNTDRTRRLEAAEINKSLLALKECIRALAEGQKHIPFRGSVLTSVLKDSFIGNCKTVMIANVAPNQASCEHTMNTLRYADRVKQIKKNATAMAEDAEAELLEHFAELSKYPASRGPSMLQRSTRSAAPVMRDGGGDAAPGTKGRGHRGAHSDLAALHKRHIQDTSVLLQKEREILAKAERHGPASEEYLTGLGKLLQHKSGMVGRMMQLLSSANGAGSNEAGRARGRTQPYVGK